MGRPITYRDEYHRIERERHKKLRESKKKKTLILQSKKTGEKNHV